MLRRCLSAAGALALGLVVMAPPVAAAPGDPDPTFDGDGIVLTDDPPITGEHPLDVVVQPDGKVVVVADGADTMVVARFTTDGALDPTFSDDGWLAVGIAGAEYGYGVAADLDSEGRILVGGKFSQGLVVARLWPGGRIDRGYGNAGRVLVPNTGPTAFLGDLVVDAANRVVFGGYELTGSFEPDGSRMLVGRLTAGGAPDPSFQGDGLVAIDPPRDSSVNAVAVAADGRIVAAGQHRPTQSGQGRTAVVRLWPNGRRDRSFGDDGIASLDLGPGGETATSVATQAGGRVALGGFAIDGRRMVVARLNAVGLPDPSFGGGDGVVLQDLGQGDERVSEIVVGAGGRLVVAGEMRSGLADQQIAVLRYGVDGALDAGFSGNGWAAVNPSPRLDVADAVGLGPSGQVVVGFRGYFDDASRDALGVVRLQG